MINVDDITETECRVDAALMVRGGKWKALILYRLHYGPKRFGDLKRLVTGISEKVLIQQLRELAAAEVLVRRDYQWGTVNRARIKAMPSRASTSRRGGRSS